MNDSIEDEDLADRIRRYAAEGAERAPGPHALEIHSARRPPLRSIALILTAITGIAAAGILAVLLQTPRTDVAIASPDESASTQPSISLSESTPSALPTVPSPTPLPSATNAPITGEVPGPEIKPPDRPAGLPGVSVQAIANAVATYGLACDSFARDPEMGSDWGLQCFGESNEASMTVRASYWTADYVDEIHAVFVASKPDGQLDPSKSTGMYTDLASLAVNKANQAQAEAFIIASTSDSECADSCSLATDGLNVILETGSNGATALTLRR
jgi:hypothetical protein